MRPLSALVYPWLSEGLFALAYPWLYKKYKGPGFQERKGYYPDSFLSLRSEKSQPIWVHGVSVGEVQSASPFIKEISENSKFPVVLSTTTPTGRLMAENILSGRLESVIYYPWDRPSIVKRALKSINPRAYGTVETEIWPCLIWEAKRRSIPIFMVNGRFSRKTLDRMGKFRSFWLDVLSCYDILMVRSPADEEGLKDLGVKKEKIKVTGDCKLDSIKDKKKTSDNSKFLWIKEGPGPVIVAGSTHEGEERAVKEAFCKVLKVYPKAKLLVVPRHPHRSYSVFEIFKDLDKTCFYTDPKDQWKIMVVDEIGILFWLYGLSDCAFVGGSLVPKGGQNVMEPASWGVPFSQGPNHRDFEEASRELFDLGIGTEVQDGETLGEAFLRDLKPERKAYVAGKSREYLSREVQSAKKSWKILEEFLVRRDEKLK